MGLCNQLNYYVTGLAGEQVEFRKLLKRDTSFDVTEKMKEEFESAKEEIGENVLLNSFNMDRRSLVVTNAYGHGFRHILLQQ